MKKRLRKKIAKKKLKRLTMWCELFLMWYNITYKNNETYLQRIKEITIDFINKYNSWKQ